VLDLRGGSGNPAKLTPLDTSAKAMGAIGVGPGVLGQSLLADAACSRIEAELAAAAYGSAPPPENLLLAPC